MRSHLSIWNGLLKAQIVIYSKSMNWEYWWLVAPRPSSSWGSEICDDNIRCWRPLSSALHLSLTGTPACVNELAELSALWSLMVMKGLYKSFHVPWWMPNGDDNAIISQSITVKRCFMWCPLYETISRRRIKLVTSMYLASAHMHSIGWWESWKQQPPQQQ